jgi:peptidoglycan/xylan/chitin deacetylase (PgdA/CDA1 family)
MHALKNLTRTAIYRMATWEPWFEPLRQRRLGGKAVIFMYHELAADDDEIESWTVVRRSDFMRQMDYLRARFDIVSLAQAIERMSLPNDAERPLAVLTFDDGDRGNRDVLLPIVEALALPVTIFVATRQVQDQELYWFDRLINALQTDQPVVIRHPALSVPVCPVNATRGARNWSRIEQLLSALKALDPQVREQVVEDILQRLPARSTRRRAIAPLSVRDVRELAGSPFVTVGAHSHCHNILTQLDGATARETIGRSKALLESWTGRTIDYFAYPNGDYNDSVIEAVATAGFKAAVAGEPRLWSRGENLLALPRIGVGRYDTHAVFKAKASGGLGAVFR